jgi:hypothetical protein
VSVIGALTLIGIALFLGGLLFRRVPGSYLALGTVIVALGLGIPAIVIDDNRSEVAAGGGGGGGETAAGGEGGGGGAEGGGGAGGGGAEGGGSAGGGGANEQGKLIFTQSCGTCHILADAGTNGQVGPPLDDLKPNRQRVLAAIENGGTGSGAMPANIVTGKDAQAVARYVASVAGK